MHGVPSLVSTYNIHMCIIWIGLGVRELRILRLSVKLPVNSTVCRRIPVGCAWFVPGGRGGAFQFRFNLTSSPSATSRSLHCCPCCSSCCCCSFCRCCCSFCRCCCCCWRVSGDLVGLGLAVVARLLMAGPSSSSRVCSARDERMERFQVLHALVRAVCGWAGARMVGTEWWVPHGGYRIQRDPRTGDF